MKIVFKNFMPFIICVVSLICMAVSCPCLQDPFEEKTNEGLGTLGFYVGDVPVRYGDVGVRKEGKDSLIIYSTLYSSHYDLLTIKFAVGDMSLDVPIADPEINLTYLYHVSPYQNEFGELSSQREYKTLVAEKGHLSFRYIGQTQGTVIKNVMSGNFSFEGTKLMSTGESQKLMITDGTFDLTY